MREYISDFKGCVKFVLVLAVVTGVLFELANRALMNVVKNKPWWSQAIPLQKGLMMNFGYPEELCSPEVCLESYCFVLLFCGHHFLCGCALLPVVVYGWEAAGPGGQTLFLLGALADVSICIFDEMKAFCLLWFPHTFSCLGPPYPLPFYIILQCLHHPLAIGMGIPMLFHCPHLRAFHFIAVSLLLAAGICFTTGSYKFMLDTKTRSGFLQYKAIVLLQLVTIWFTRGFVWFSQVYAALSTFRAEGSTAFFIGGCIAAGLMSLFNLVMMADSLDAAKKWLPRSMPSTEEGQNELAETMIISRSKSTIGLPDGVYDLFSPQAKKFRASIKVALAASKFKQGLKNH